MIGKYSVSQSAARENADRSISVHGVTLRLTTELVNPFYMARLPHYRFATFWSRISNERIEDKPVRFETDGFEIFKLERAGHSIVYVVSCSIEHGDKLVLSQVAIPKLIDQPAIAG